MKYYYHISLDDNLNDGLRDDIDEFRGSIAEYQSNWPADHADRIAVRIGEMVCSITPSYIPYTMTIRLWDASKNFLGVFAVNTDIVPKCEAVDVTDDFKNFKGHQDLTEEEI